MTGLDSFQKRGKGTILVRNVVVFFFRIPLCDVLFNI